MSNTKLLVETTNEQIKKLTLENKVSGLNNAKQVEVIEVEDADKIYSDYLEYYQGSKTLFEYLNSNGLKLIKYTNE